MKIWTTSFTLSFSAFLKLIGRTVPPLTLMFQKGRVRDRVRRVHFSSVRPSPSVNTYVYVLTFEYLRAV